MLRMLIVARILSYPNENKTINNDSEEVNMRHRAEFNNSSPMNKPKQGQGQPLITTSEDEVKLNTHNYFHPSKRDKMLNEDLHKSGDKDSPRFRAETRNYESSKSYSGYPMKNNGSYKTPKDDITEYTKEEMHVFETVFNTFDKDNSGHVRVDDLKAIFESMR